MRTDSTIINQMERPFKGKYCNAPAQTGCRPPPIRDHLFVLLRMSVISAQITVGASRGA